MSFSVIQIDLRFLTCFIRPNGILSWNKDSPLTNVGILQGQLVGKALKRRNVCIDSVYCSPSYRCIQTCNAVLEGLQLKDIVAINIEPALFEFLQWYQDELPDFLSPEQLRHNGFNINIDYKSILSVSQLDMHVHESLTDFYKRNFKVVELELQNQTFSDSNVLIVGHATTLDTCSRPLLGKSIPTPNIVSQVMQKIPFASLIELKEVEKNNWKLKQPPVLPLMHTNNGRFNWKIFDGL